MGTSVGSASVIIMVHRKTHMKRRYFAATAVAATLLAGCSSSTTSSKKAAPKEPPKPVSGQSAAYLMFQAARQWAPDVLLLNVESLELETVKSQPGLYGAWRATFVSPSKRMSKTYMYGVDEVLPIRKGVASANETSYAQRLGVRTFNIQGLKTDSPAALEEALKDKEVKAMADKHPDSPITFQLECTQATQYQVAWRVIWGSSVSQSVGSAYISSETGKFIKRQR